MADQNDDLSRKLSALLSDPEGMARIRSVLGTLGAADEAPAPPPTPPAENPLPDLSAIGSLLPLLGNLGREDENTALLKALRPYLHGGREKRLDDSIKMLQLLRFLPLLKEKGLF